MSGEAWTRLWRDRTPGLLGAKHAYAVLCPFLQGPEGWRLLFEVRSSRLRRQGGEVCFPGGKMEPGESPEDCALRETEEELAIPRKRISLLGRSDFLCQMGKFILQPVPGIVDEAGFSRLVPSPAEVAAVFTVPLSFFRENPPETYTYAIKPDHTGGFPYEAVGVPLNYQWEEGTVEVPVWHWQGHTIWGMTARIVKNLLDTIEAAGYADR
jgi:8-oxo-dGTP pyrophosphatase MutT (NUDIX family)